MTDSTKNINSYIEGEIEKSGFPLEISSAITLQRHNWNVTPHVLFRSRPEKPPKELDIFAQRKTKLIKNGFDILVIECKKQTEKPWVFFQGEQSISSVLSLGLTEPDLYPVFEKKYWGSHFYYGTKPCSYHLPCFVKKNDGDVILSAIDQVLAALRFFRKQKSTRYELTKSSHFAIVYPVIVFDGKLFIANVKPDREIEVRGTKYLRLRVREALDEAIDIDWSDGKRIVIDVLDHMIEVVHKDYFDEFLKIFD